MENLGCTPQLLLVTSCDYLIKSQFENQNKLEGNFLLYKGALCLRKPRPSITEANILP